MTEHLSWFNLFTTTIPHQASFIHRSLFDRIGLYDESYRITGDCRFFMLALIKNKASYEFIPKPIAIFNELGISSSNDASEEFIRQRKGIFPECISRMDVDAIEWVNLLRTSKFAYFIFRIAVFIARQKQKFRVRRLTRQLLKSAGNLKK